MNMAGEESADPAKRPIASDVGDDRGMPNADVLPRKAPRWLLWVGAAVAAALCAAILLMWGIHGPTYLFDLIAAYCL